MIEVAIMERMEKAFKVCGTHEQQFKAAVAVLLNAVDDKPDNMHERLSVGECELLADLMRQLVEEKQVVDKVTEGYEARLKTANAATELAVNNWEHEVEMRDLQIKSLEGRLRCIRRSMIALAESAALYSRLDIT